MKSKILIWQAGGRRAPAADRRAGDAPRRKGGAFVCAFTPNAANRTKVETPLAFPSGEGGPLAVDEEIDLPQNILTPYGGRGTPRGE